MCKLGDVLTLIEKNAIFARVGICEAVNALQKFIWEFPSDVWLTWVSSPQETMIASSISYTAEGKTLNKLNKTLGRRSLTFEFNPWLPCYRHPFSWRDLRLLQMRSRGGSRPCHILMLRSCVRAVADWSPSSGTPRAVSLQKSSWMPRGDRSDRWQRQRTEWYQVAEEPINIE